MSIAASDIVRAQAGDRDAVDRVVAGSLRFVYAIANSFRRQAIDRDDLVQEGCLGVLHALRRYDPARGAFLTYAAWWIRQYMDRALLTMRTIHVPVRVHEIIGRAGRLGVDLQDADAAARIGCSVSAARAALALRGLTLTVSLDAPVANRHDDGDLLLDGALSVDEAGYAAVEDADRYTALHVVLNTLPARSRAVVLERAAGHTLEACARAHGLSRERTRQIERSALAAIRKALRVAPR